MSLTVEIRSLCAGYDKKEIVRELSLTISPGEIISVIGPNGSGKSTLLKTLSGQLSILSGHVFYGDKELTNMGGRERAEQISVLLTDRVHPELLTVREVVALGRIPYTGRLGGLSQEDERAVDRAIRDAGIGELQELDFNTLSDGQKQRVLLARAFCQEPEVLILDEPTAYLDIRYKLQLLEALRHKADTSGITVLMSIHEIELASMVSDQMILLKEGHVQSIGTPKEVFTRDKISALYDIPEEVFLRLYGSFEGAGR
jgi:iron complex transport system ATP-binding protein